MKNIFYISIILLLSSCTNEKNFVMFHVKHEQKAAKNCAIWYPVKETTKEVVTYKEGSIIELPGETKYIKVDCDSVVNIKTNIPGDIIYVKVPGKVRVDTFWQKEVVTVENTAYKSYLLDSIGVLCQAKDKETQRLGEVKATRNRLWIILSALGLATGVVWYVKAKASFINKIV